MTDLKINSYPLHIGDWHSGTSRMSLAEAGAYIRLCNQYYLDQGEGWTVNECLRICSAVAKDEQRAVKAVLSSKFDAVETGFRHAGMDKRIIDIEEASAKNKARAEAAARARWAKQNGDKPFPDDAPSNAPSIEQALLEDCHPKAKSQKPDKKEVAVVSASAKTDAQEVLAELQAIPGLHRSEWQGHTANIVIGWLNNGFDPQSDILPAVRARVAKLKHQPRSWEFFTESIAQAYANRTRAIPIPDAQAPPSADPWDIAIHNITGGQAA